MEVIQKTDAEGNVIIPDPTVTQATLDEQGNLTQLNGTAATATHATDTDFEQEEIEKKIADLWAFKFPLLHDIVREATQSKVKSMHPFHFRSGSANLSLITAQAITVPAGGVDLYAEVTVARAIIGDAFDSLSESSCIYVSNVSGYAEDGATPLGDLALYVVEKDKANVTFGALNPSKTATITIPANTELVIGATAGSESQMIVDPDNYQPTKYEVYLQKKLANIVITDEWLEQIKKVPFVEKDLRNNALYNFKRKAARTHWKGAKKRITRNVKNIGPEAIYFEQGILYQLPLAYSRLRGAFKPADLNAIAKLQFTNNSVSNSARVYCGKNAIEDLNNMDVTVYKEVKFEDVVEAGMNIRKWRSGFGVLEFVYDPTLDDIGLADFMVAIDIKNAVRYVKREQKVDTIDLKKDGHEAREAKRDVFSMIDCIALKGYNATLIGPSDTLMQVASPYGSIEAVVEVYEGETAPTDTTKVYLLTKGFGTFAKGSIVEYKEGNWVDFEGVAKLR